MPTRPATTARPRRGWRAYAALVTLVLAVLCPLVVAGVQGMPGGPSDEESSGMAGMAGMSGMTAVTGTDRSMDDCTVCFQDGDAACSAALAVLVLVVSGLLLSALRTAWLELRARWSRGVEPSGRRVIPLLDPPRYALCVMRT